MAFGFVAFHYFNEDELVKQNDNFFDNVQNTLSCAKEGEGIGTCVGCLTTCCEGLRGMAYLKYDSGCIKLPAPGLGATCSKCGNGTCDKTNREDECNCPEDCK